MIHPAELAKLALSKLNSGEIESLQNVDDRAIGALHNTLGRWIRNEFKLWEQKWEPEIKDGVDHSPYHPDNLSFAAIVLMVDVAKGRTSL